MISTPLRPVMVGVAGASGSGKSMLASEVAQELGGFYFSMDSYYRDLSHLPVQDRAKQNFDDPAMIDAGLLATHIQALSGGRAIEQPVYDYATYIRDPLVTVRVEPGSLMVIEGLFTLYFPELRPYYHLSVFVDTADDVCFARRLKRDVEERGRTPESIRQQYDATVRPCGLAFVRPLIDFADLVLEGSDALDFKVEQVVSALRKRGLLAGLRADRRV